MPSGQALEMKMSMSWEDVEEDWEPEKIAKKVEPFVIENAIDTVSASFSIKKVSSSN